MNPELIFKALADETRIRLLNIAMRHELHVNELVAVLAMGQSRISRHLKILADAGLLQTRRDGLRIFYAAASDGQAGEHLRAMRALLAAEGHYAMDGEACTRAVQERSQAAVRFFDTVASDWATLQHDIIGSADLESMLRAHMQPVAVAADLGCGSGRSLALLGEFAHTVIGVDPSSRMLAMARESCGLDNGKIDLRIGELEHLPMRDAEADAVLINMVLHHLSDPLTGLREAQRVLRPGSSVYIVELLRHQLEWLHTRYHDHYLGFQRNELKQWLMAAGFTPLSEASQQLNHGLQAMMIHAKKGGTHESA